MNETPLLAKFNYLNGKIDSDGYLYILRGKQYKQQYCRYSGICGDWCPQFGEPVIKNKVTIHLKICQNRILEFSNFEDER